MSKYAKIPERCKDCAYLARYYVRGAAEFKPVDFGKCLKRTWENGCDFHPSPAECAEFVPYAGDEEKLRRIRSVRETVEEISAKLDALLAALNAD